MRVKYPRKKNRAVVALSDSHFLGNSTQSPQVILAFNHVDRAFQVAAFNEMRMKSALNWERTYEILKPYYPFSSIRFSLRSDTVKGLVDILVVALKDAKTQTASFTPGSKQSFRVTSIGGQGYVLGQVGISCFDHALELLMADPFIGEFFSRRFLQGKLSQLIPVVLPSTDQELLGNVTSQVESLILSLEKMPLLKWTVMIPIVNLTLKIPPLAIGNVTFTAFDHSAEENVLSTFKQIDDTGTSPEPVKREFAKIAVERIHTKYLGRTVASIIVEAADGDNAVEKAEGEVEHALNVLRFYSRAALNLDARRSRIFIGADGTVFDGIFTSLCFRQGEQFNLPFRKTGYFFPYELDENALASMEKLALPELSRFLGKRAALKLQRESNLEGFNKDNYRTTFEDLLITAVDFYGIAMNQLIPRDAFLQFVISLEAVLLKANEPRGLLAERVALIATDNYKARKDLFEEMKAIYTMRSQIVHRGFTDVTEEDLWPLSAIALHVIFLLLSMSSKINDIGKLVGACQRTKFSGPLFTP